MFLIEFCSVSYFADLIYTKNLAKKKSSYKICLDILIRNRLFFSNDTFCIWVYQEGYLCALNSEFYG